ncbi:ABC transporter ATP-binding protein [Rhizobacter sp. LjRoot28]|uniref:ABC transporter ATP-binding protein n=1 Tax=Rhizobacter sp. LjRoot28 TaxID=3342309 RepID=UPI003ECCD8F3
MSQPLLAVEGLRVEFRVDGSILTALDNVSFTIGAGEILGVVGESGAGKSLTGAALLGLIDPPGRVSAGRMQFDGQMVDLRGDGMIALRGRHIGAIFQDPLTALDPLFTVGQQLVETLRMHLPLSARQARLRAAELLQETGIADAEARLDQYPHQFSGGMRQRVVIALALAAQPQLIIADEPTTALDVSVQSQVILLLKRLCGERGLAVILITHDMGVIAQACDRVAVMYSGRVVEIGPVRSVVQAPAHPYTRGLMAAIPSTKVRRKRLQQIDGTMPRLDAIPPGCAFHPRCPDAFGPCDVERPDLLEAGQTRAACWLHRREKSA